MRPAGIVPRRIRSLQRLNISLFSKIEIGAGFCWSVNMYKGNKPRKLYLPRDNIEIIILSYDKFT